MIPIRDNIVSRTIPVVNYGIIATCIAVFIGEQTHLFDAQAYAFKPAFLFSLGDLLRLGPVDIVGRLMLSTFMHAGIMHIGFNMLFLYVFGDNVEDRMGHARYLAFYLLCGFLATIAHSLMAVVGLGLGDRAGLQTPVIGASGAIAGVLGAYLFLFRGALVRTLFIIVIIPLFFDIPAAVFIIIWIAVQVFQGVGTLGVSGAGVAFWAHIGGFAAGYYLVRRFVPGNRRLPPRPRILRMDNY
jgi:membrane associated rhomboid family serine protease